jgi:membrane protease YdiL (CAAX protease family)
MHDLQIAALLAVACLAFLAAIGRLRFLVREFRGRARRTVAAALLCAVLVVSVFFPTVSGGDADLQSTEDLWFPALFAGHALLATFLLAWWRLRRRGSLAELLLLHRVQANDIWHGMWIGAMGWVAALLVMAALAGIGAMTGLGAEGPREVPPLMLWLAQLPLWRKLVIIAVSMTVEEMFFRAFLQPRIGWIASSCLFALAHAGYGLPLMLAGVLVLSLLIGWTLKQTERLLPCIVAHGVFNGIQLLVIMPFAVRMLEQGGSLPFPA